MTIKTMLMTAALLTATVCGALGQGAGAPQGGGGMTACRADAQKFCGGKSGADRRACMDVNKDKLSDACKALRAARASGAR
jgi:hypothetical protein